MPSVDLNADMGESFGPWVMGQDEALLKVITSANIACGMHAGKNIRHAQQADAAHQDKQRTEEKQHPAQHIESLAHGVFFPESGRDCPRSPNSETLSTATVTMNPTSVYIRAISR